jgi:hypothetical protein
MATKKRLAAPQKTIYNRKAKGGTRWLAPRFPIRIG